MCSNGTRIFVQSSILKAFLEKLVMKVKSMKIGDPLKEETMVGAMICGDQATRVVEYVQGALEQVSCTCHWWELDELQVMYILCMH